jgi:hypothetical protein
MKNSQSNWSLLDSASRWMRNTLSRHADDAALADSGEAEHIARDLNLSVAELHALCAKHGGSPKLLKQRLAQLHLDKNEVKRAHPGVVRDLEKVCALCTTDAKCSRDFDRTPDPAGWTDYCPNADTLQELAQEAARKDVA